MGSALFYTACLALHGCCFEWAILQLLLLALRKAAMCRLKDRLVVLTRDFALHAAMSAGLRSQAAVDQGTKSEANTGA